MASSRAVLINASSSSSSGGSEFYKNPPAPTVAEPAMPTPCGAALELVASLLAAQLSPDRSLVLAVPVLRPSHSHLQPTCHHGAGQIVM